MEISVTISQMAVLFIILAVGYGANKLKMMSAESDAILTKLVLNITIPCTILNSVMGGGDGITGGETAYFVLMSLIVYGLFFLIALPATLALRADKADRGLLCFMTVFGNVGFMGIPVIQAVFGGATAFYAALFNIPFNLLAFSVGVIMISGGRSGVNPKKLFNPSIAFIFVAIIILITGFEVPAVIRDVIVLLGGMTTPCAMLIVGSTLAQITFRDVFSEWRLYVVTLLKLIVMPVVTWLVMRLLVTDEIMLGVLVILSGMPSAAITTMIALQHGSNERLASSGVFLATLLSGVTIPLIVWLLLM